MAELKTHKKPYVKIAAITVVAAMALRGAFLPVVLLPPPETNIPNEIVLKNDLEKTTHQVHVFEVIVALVAVTLIGLKIRDEIIENNRFKNRTPEQIKKDSDAHFARMAERQRLYPDPDANLTWEERQEKERKKQENERKQQERKENRHYRGKNHENPDM